jgi:hypothetical protein
MTTTEQIDGVRRLLTDYKDVFAAPGGPLGVGHVEPHRIDMGNNAPVKQWTFCMSAEIHKVVQTECEKMLELGVIRDSKSLWSSPVVLVTKKNGDVRFCMDYLLPRTPTRFLTLHNTLGALGGMPVFLYHGFGLRVLADTHGRISARRHLP